MFKNRIHHRTFAIFMVTLMMASCTSLQNHFNANEAAAQPPDQIQDPEQGSSRSPASQGERIHIEDENAQINELRIRGQTQSIEVKPQNNMPTYEIVPENSATPSNNAAGRSRWRVLSF